MQKFRWLAILMGITILGITGFQGYWLKNNYDREKLSLELKTNASFRQTVIRLQASKLKLDNINLHLNQSIDKRGKIVVRPPFGVKPPFGERPPLMPDTLVPENRSAVVPMMQLLRQKLQDYGADTTRKKTFVFTTTDSLILMSADSLKMARPTGFPKKIQTITIAASGDSTIDPEIVRELAESKRLQKNGQPGVVTIDYSPKRPRTKKGDTVVIGASGNGFVERTLPAQDVLTLRDSTGNDDAVFRFLYSMDSVSAKDSITIKEIIEAYTTRLKEDKLNLPFEVSRIESGKEDTTAQNEVTLGFLTPTTYRLSLPTKINYVLKQLTLPMLFSLFLVGITIVSFVLLYRSLLRQHRLAELKNQFISNITHELKTPIATVGVAIEALQNFNAIHDPKRTKEYLDISQNELQRLSLLVDKVLKLSMFEKKEIELKKEQFDYKQLVEEVMNSMKLQFEKYHAKVKLHTEGNNFIIDADKLHITSVVYNLLDNALKYSQENPVIDVQLVSNPEYIELNVTDNGIGIEPVYREKIFEKFFRVPTGDKHNIKGYGLGLSYVAEVVKRHDGNVFAKSELGKGSTFTAQMPYDA